ncbi:MAG: hypothetical protein ACW981_08915 [Candidatus Hodarchaeales archaeon]|jgi:hypothetical protein
MNWKEYSKLRKILILMILPIIFNFIFVITILIGSLRRDFLLLFFISIVIQFVVVLLFFTLLSLLEATPELEKIFLIGFEFFFVGMSEFFIFFLMTFIYVFITNQFSNFFFIVGFLINIVFLLLFLLVFYLFLFFKYKRIISDAMQHYDKINTNNSSKIELTQQIDNIFWNYSTSRNLLFRHKYFFKNFASYGIPIIIFLIILIFSQWFISQFGLANNFELFFISIWIPLIIFVFIAMRIGLLRGIDALMLAQKFKEELVIYSNGLSIPPIMQPYCLLLNAKRYSTKKNIIILYSQIENIDIRKFKIVIKTKGDYNMFLLHFNTVMNEGLAFKVTKDKDSIVKIFEEIKRKEEEIQERKDYFISSS